MNRRLKLFYEKRREINSGAISAHAIGDSGARFSPESKIYSVNSERALMSCIIDNAFIDNE